MGKQRNIAARLSGRTGIAKPTLHNILRGARRPSWDKAQAMAAATNQGPGFFMDLKALTLEEREAALDTLELLPLGVFQACGGESAPVAAADRPKKPRRSARPKSTPPRTERKNEAPPENPLKPRKRGDCENGPRPCPWLSCKWHMWRDRRDIKRFLLQCPNLDVALAVVLGMRETCALDYCNAPITDRQIAPLFGVTHQAIAQAAKRGLAKLRREEVKNLLDSWERLEHDTGLPRDNLVAAVRGNLP